MQILHETMSMPMAKKVAGKIGSSWRSTVEIFLNSRVLKQATVDNFPVGVRWISGLI